jgi:hypothetical protein
MDRALAEQFVSELTVMGDHLNRLYELIHMSVPAEDLQKECRKSLGEVMAAASVMMRLRAVTPTWTLTRCKAASVGGRSPIGTFGYSDRS